MPDQDYLTPAPTVSETTAQEVGNEADYGSNSEQQCALAYGCDGDVPPLDDVFREGFVDEHLALVADIAEVTARSVQLKAEVPSPEHAALLDHHIDGVFALEDALADAIATAQAGSAYGEGETIDVDQASVDTALELWARLEVALDVLREHNGLYAAVLAADLVGQLHTLSSLAAAIVESAMGRFFKEQGAETQQAFDEYQNAWKVAALSVAKIPADIAVDVAVGAAITAAMPLLIGGTVTGTIPAVFIGIGIATAASLAWNYTSAKWGPDMGSLHESVTKVNTVVDIGAEATSIDQVGQGFKAGAENVGKTSLYLTVLLDAAAAGVAIDGLWEASIAWERFQIERQKLEDLWNQALVLFTGFTRFAESMKQAIPMLADDINRRRDVIMGLESVYGAGLYEV